MDQKAHGIAIVRALYLACSHHKSVGLNSRGKVRKRTVALQDTAASTRVSRTVRRTWYTRIFQCPQVPISYQISCSWTMGQGRLKCLIFFKRNEKTRLLEKKVCVYFSDSFSYVHLHTEMETALAFFDI